MKIFNKKMLAIVASFSFVMLAAGTAIAGYYPADRQTYTCVGNVCPGADHVVFNSFTNNPVVGDERPFFAGSIGGANVQDRMKVNNGDTITLRAYVHNNADPNKIGKEAALAKNVKIKILVPTAKQADSNMVAFISASNANPAMINDTMSVYGDRAFTLNYVQGSAQWETNGGTVKLNDTIVGDGTYLGDLDGCFEYSGYVTVTVKVKMDEAPKPESIYCDALQVNILNKDKREVEAKVTGSATNTTIDGYKIDFGDGTVENSQTAKHTYGDYGKYTIVAHVSGKVDGKTETVTSAACKKTVEFKKPPVKQSISCDALQVNILNKDKREVEAKVTGSATNTKIDGYKIDFGDGTTVNEQTAKHTYGDYGKYTVTAYVSGMVDGKKVEVSGPGCVQTVEFKKPPKPQEQMISCDALALDVFNKDTKYVEVSVTGSAQNTKIDGYKIDFGDGTVENSQTAKHTYGDYGKYTIVAHVSGKVDGKTETVTSAACKKTVEFKKPPTPEIQSINCDALNLDLFNKDKRYVKVSVDATAQNTKIDTYEINFGDGSSPVMDQTAEHTYSDYGTYKIVASVSGQVDGETVTDTNANCEQTVEFKTPEEPETPPTTPETPELPNTGAGALVGLFSGASILGAISHRIWTIRRFQ